MALTTYALYLGTLAPGVLHYARPELLDAATLQVHAAKLGITHPTGYPTFLLLTHLFTYLPIGEVAYRVNLAVAVYAALAVGGVYAAGYLLTRRVVAAASGALCFGLGATFWSSATSADVYALNALFIALCTCCLLLWEVKRHERYLLLLALCLGLSMTNHLTSGMMIPAALLFVGATNRSRLRDVRLCLSSVGLFVLGLLPYAYLPIRASMDPPFMEGDPTSPGRFLTQVTGQEVSRALLHAGPAELPGRLALYAVELFRELPPLFVLIGVVGAVALFARSRAAVALTGVPFAGWLVHALIYDIHDVSLYFIPTYLMFSLWVANGAATLLKSLENRSVGDSGRSSRGPVYLLAAALVLLPLAGVPDARAEADRSDDREGRRTIEAVAEHVEPGATVLHNRSSLWYMVLVEERRQDLTLLDPFIPEAITTYDQVWPDDLSPEAAARRYGTDDNTGVEAARLAARDGPVYILDQESADGRDFLWAGFEIVPVEDGVLYQLRPPE